MSWLAFLIWIWICEVSLIIWCASVFNLFTGDLVPGLLLQLDKLLMKKISMEEYKRNLVMFIWKQCNTLINLRKIIEYLYLINQKFQYDWRALVLRQYFQAKFSSNPIKRKIKKDEAHYGAIMPYKNEGDITKQGIKNNYVLILNYRLLNESHKASESGQLLLVLIIRRTRKQKPTGDKPWNNTQRWDK